MSLSLFFFFGLHLTRKLVDLSFCFRYYAITVWSIMSINLSSPHLKILDITVSYFQISDALIEVSAMPLLWYSLKLGTKQCFFNTFFLVKDQLGCFVLSFFIWHISWANKCLPVKHFELIARGERLVLDLLVVTW